MSQKHVDARLIGIVGKVHGIKGEVNVMLLTDYPDSIFKGTSVYLDKHCSEKIIIEKIVLRMKKGRASAIIKFEGIDSRESAEGMRRQELYRNPQDSPVPGSGEFWVDDLEGCIVCLDHGVVLGTVEKVEEIPSNQNLIVRLEDRDLKINGIISGCLYIPFIDDYIKSIDIGEKKIILKKIPEYI
ncbi:MAG TPA: 16S rRNA processing protein RimM [Actinobacteria bacterium]|nr:16S rRNA processing protein RimM [Actinomycetota bacterium]